MDCLEPAERIFPDTTGCELAAKLCEFRRDPTHFDKALEDRTINFRRKKAADQPIHHAPMIIRHEVGFAGKEHLLKLHDVGSHS